MSPLNSNAIKLSKNDNKTRTTPISSLRKGWFFFIKTFIRSILEHPIEEIARFCHNHLRSKYAAGTVGRKVYKITNPSTGDVVYTTSQEEADVLATAGFTCEEAEFVVY